MKIDYNFKALVFFSVILFAITFSSALSLGNSINPKIEINPDPIEDNPTNPNQNSTSDVNNPTNTTSMNTTNPSADSQVNNPQALENSDNNKNDGEASVKIEKSIADNSGLSSITENNLQNEIIKLQGSKQKESDDTITGAVIGTSAKTIGLIEMIYLLILLGIFLLFLKSKEK